MVVDRAPASGGILIFLVAVKLMKYLLAGILFVSAMVRASDWPQFLGPARNGVYPRDDLAETWPKDGFETITGMSVFSASFIVCAYEGMSGVKNTNGCCVVYFHGT